VALKNIDYQRLLLSDFAANDRTMDATKATQIRLLILEAADAIERAHAIVSTLSSDDQAWLSAPLDEISLAIHAKLLQQLYLDYPGLKEEGPVWHGAVT
jgi:hypothetical protein